MLPVMEKPCQIFVCDHCGAVVQQGGAVTDKLVKCPRCNAVRIRGEKGYPVSSEKEQVATERGNTKSERG